MIDVLRAQLLSVRAQIDATLAVIDGLTVQAPEPPVCPHEPKNFGTFGAPDWRCEICKQPVEPMLG